MINKIGVIDTTTPINTTFVKGMPQRGDIAFLSQSGALCGGVRGQPAADQEALLDAIVRIGQLAFDHPELAELDVDPLLVLPEGQGVVAVDVRVVLT
jgi:hypothetical protein